MRRRVAHARAGVKIRKGRGSVVNGAARPRSRCRAFAPSPRTRERGWGEGLPLILDGDVSSIGNGRSAMGNSQTLTPALSPEYRAREDGPAAYHVDSPSAT